MKFSFIIPMFNEEEDIMESVDSCLKQEFPKDDYEIILVDDGSSDNGYERCLLSYNDLSNVHVFRYEKNKGVSYARNFGVERSNGNVLIFLNADECVPEDFLIKIDAHYQDGADYIYPQTRVANVKSKYGFFRDSYRLYKYNKPNTFLWSQGFSCTKISFMKVKGFDSRYPKCGGEDWDFTSKLDMFSLKRVVDLNIIVTHKVPENLKNIIWHMYNRGRGSANFDLIRLSKSAIKYLLINILKVVAFVIICIFKPIIAVTLLATGTFKTIDMSMKMFKNYENEGSYFSLLFMLILNKILRKIGYDFTMLLYSWNRYENI